MASNGEPNALATAHPTSSSVIIAANARMAWPNTPLDADRPDTPPDIAVQAL
ncbi:hypothetical protein [Sphingomonas abietis]|uniref:Uncharacterized protein n=1 Tax=Sphingomonas abietis TaxID=3012344 RepID=A0ABY7NLB6_9SPHN|nr:hypothetical protein [Sphingomonas abietis]WBO22037.1 hypothetical protein PBT88_18050 [Sphingomonas abietis]